MEGQGTMKLRPPSEYEGQVKCPCCGVDGNGDRWAICVDGYTHAESCAIYIYAADVCPECALEIRWIPNPDWNKEVRER